MTDLLPTWREWLAYLLVVVFPLAVGVLLHVVAWLLEREPTRDAVMVTDDTGHTTELQPIE